MSELVLDIRQEILDIIDKTCHKYNHINPYVHFDSQGCVDGCCVNGLVMMYLGWEPNKSEWERNFTSSLPGAVWQKYARKISERYGPNALGDINCINNVSDGWVDAKNKLADYWWGSGKLPPR